MITGQGMCMFVYWTSGARDVCMITGQGMCMYDYWTSWARVVCVLLLDKGSVCMITGQAGQGMSV
jgi:uncharacterized membrane protein